MNNKVLWIVGGCAVLLLVCCVAVFGIYFVFGETIQKQIMTSLGTSVELPMATVAPGLPPLGKGTVAPVPTSGAASSAASSSLASRSSASSGVAPSAGNPLGNAKTATKYRMEFSWIIGGMQSGKYQEQPFFDMTGETDGPNSHLTSKGGLMAMLGGSDKTPIEIIEAGGKTYMKGVTMFGLTDPKVWYITDDSTTSGFTDMAKPNEWSSFTGGNEKDLKKVRTESLDGQSCDVWVYDFKTMQNSALTGLLSMGGNKSGAFSAIDKAEVAVWLCGDGFVHKYSVDYQGHDAKDTTQKGALKINAHMWDFGNAAIKVTVPADAKPMPK
ncbi:MAG: hypothetical protein HZB51_28845 [Chloroflexi bacterium]|nr:hypothetical protein [Chloroflexota bacterium]